MTDNSKISYYWSFMFPGLILPSVDTGLFGVAVSLFGVAVGISALRLYFDVLKMKEEYSLLSSILSDLRNNRLELKNDDSQQNDSH